MGTCFTATDSFSKFSEYSPCRTCKLKNSLLSLSYHHHKAIHSKNHLSFWRKIFLQKWKFEFREKPTEKFAKFCLHNADHHHFSSWRYFFTTKLTKLKTRTNRKFVKFCLQSAKHPLFWRIFFRCKIGIRIFGKNAVFKKFFSSPIFWVSLSNVLKCK